MKNGVCAEVERSSLSQDGIAVNTFDIKVAPGTAWICGQGGECGGRDLRGRGAPGDWRLDLEERPGWTRSWSVGTIEASPPARR